MKQKIKKDFERNIDRSGTIGEGTTRIDFYKKKDLLSQDEMMKLKIGFKAILYTI